MPAVRSPFIAMLLAFAAWPACADTTTAAPADAPPLEAGDRWVYFQSAGNGPRGVHAEFQVAYRDDSGNWAIVGSPVGASHPPDLELQRVLGVVDGHGCMVDVAGAASLQAPPCAALPSPDDQWSMAYPLRSLRRELKVVGRESIEVPAGRFDAIKLEAFDYPAQAAGDTALYAAIRHVVLWFAPDVRAVVRAERDVVAPDASVIRRQVDVLESFVHRGRRTPAGSDAASAQRVDLRRPIVIYGSPACEPEYPTAAARAGVTGKTSLVFTVGADGRLVSADIAQSSGPTREHRMLDIEARAAFSACHFAPALDASGKPMRKSGTLEYGWKLDQDSRP